MFPICAQIEAEISDMDDEDKEMFLADLGLETSGLNRIIKEGYSLLGLISYLTAGEPEVRAWTIKRELKLHRRQERYTPTLKRASSELKLFHLTIL